MRVDAGYPHSSVSDQRERGATLVEAAVTMMLVLTVVFAIAEFGLAFRSWLTVSHAAREGARAGATFADNAAADREVLANVSEGMGSSAGVALQTVRIYDADSGTGTLYTHTGSGPCNWTPCPDPDLSGYTVPVWDPDSRDVSAPFTDRIGVEITYEHTWVTGLFRDTSVFTSDVIFQIEPQVFS